MGEENIERNIFAENYQGILTHKGTVKVAKTDITARILNISNNTALVRGRKVNGYIADIHKDLVPLMQYVEKGDTGYIKWKNGKAYLVGFKKQQKKPTPPKPTQDWISFFSGMEMEL